MARKTNENGLKLIKTFEGFRADAYVCPAGALTIGYGHTGGVKRGQKVSEQEADKLLCEDVLDAETAVERFIIRYTLYYCCWLLRAIFLIILICPHR